MKINPVYQQESRISARSFRLPLIILLCNSILALVALLDMYSMISQVKTTAEIQYSSFLSLYVFAAGMEFVLLLLIVPALTSGSISGERERQTLNLLLTTRMTPGSIVIGKLLVSLSTVFLLIISSFPILSLVFIYGGVTVTDMIVLLCCFSSTALLGGCIGLCCSSVFKRSTIATAASYCVMAFLVFGTMALWRLASAIGGTTQGKEGLACLLLANPAVTFGTVIKSQAGHVRRIPFLEIWAEGSSVSPLIPYWLAFSMAVQLLLAFLCLWIAIGQVNPRRKRRWKI